MNRYYKKIVAGVLTAGMMCSMSLSAMAASDAEYTKNENVYVRLKQDGNVEGVYVVNIFDVEKDGEITDYGDYINIQNLTNLDDIENDEEEHTFTAEEGKFYYQGELENAELPWDFDITYEVDGEEVKDEKLEGTEGDLKMLLKIRKNPACTDTTFFNTCMLQVSFTLDNDLCKNISGIQKYETVNEAGETVTTTSDASMADAGGDTRLTFVVNPGTETNIRVCAEVEDFEMDDISIAGTAVAGAAQEEASEPELDENGNPITPEPELDENGNPITPEPELDENGNPITPETDETENQESSTPVSFVSEDNKHTENVTFAISVPGVVIPDPVMEVAEEEEASFLDKIKDLFE